MCYSRAIQQYQAKGHIYKCFADALPDIPLQMLFQTYLAQNRYVGFFSSRDLPDEETIETPVKLPACLSDIHKEARTTRPLANRRFAAGQSKAVRKGKVGTHCPTPCDVKCQTSVDASEQIPHISNLTTNKQRNKTDIWMPILM
jgi:hypothetical protein